MDQMKKLYQVIHEKQIIAVLLATSIEKCKEYLINKNVVDSLEYVTITEISKDESIDNDAVTPLMIAKKYQWYDLRHSKYLYIYENIH